jgi:hypothetical protein
MLRLERAISSKIDRISASANRPEPAISRSRRAISLLFRRLFGEIPFFRGELFDRGDWEALLRYVDSDIETTEPPEIPGAARYSGYSGLAMA